MGLITMRMMAILKCFGLGESFESSSKFSKNKPIVVFVSAIFVISQTLVALKHFECAQDVVSLSQISLGGLITAISKTSK